MSTNFTIDKPQCTDALPLSVATTDLVRFLDAIGDRDRDLAVIVGENIFYQGNAIDGFQKCEVVGRTATGANDWQPSGPHYPLAHLDRVNPGGVFLRPNLVGHNKGTFQGSTVVFYEIDDLPLGEQWERLDFIKSIGLVPSAVVYSGSRSIHVYFRLIETIGEDDWLRLMMKLAVVAASDPTLCNLTRMMRLPGCHRLKNGEWVQQSLEETSPASYSAAEIETILDSTGMFPHGIDRERFKAHKWIGAEALLHPNPQWVQALARYQKDIAAGKNPTFPEPPSQSSTHRHHTKSLNTASSDLSGWLSDVVARVTPDQIFGGLEGWTGGDRNAWCPFCSEREKAPSFNVHPHKGVYHCYGCEASGNYITFLKEYEGLSGKEAIQKLEILSGIDVPDRDWHPSLTAIDGGGKRKKKSKSRRRRERKAIQAREVHHAILHPWGDREVITVHTAAEAIEFLRNHSHVMIDGATGAGKTELIAEFLKYLEKNGKSKSDFFAFTPIRSLARAAAAKFDIPYRGCVHSILATAPVMLRRDKPIAIFDEVEQNLTALLQSNLCQKDRGQKVALHSQAVQHCERVILASATASNKDVEYFEAITGKTFKILRYAPPIPSKGTLRMYQGDPDVKGSARASKNKVLGSITPRSYVASDSLKAAMDIEKRLTGDIQPGELAPVLACSKTADDDLVKAVISSPRPGDVLAGLGCPGIIATSYVQSGVSFQNPIGVQLFDRVVGVFGGNTIAPSDAFQQLERYRSDIDRHVYAPESAQPPQRLARGFAPKGSSPRSKRVADQWRSDVDSLEAAMRIGAYHDFEFIHGPERDWCQKWESQMKLEYSNYGAALAAYGLRNGYQVKWETCTDAAEVQDYRDEVRRDLAAKISNSRPIDYFEFRRLLEKPEPTVTEQDEIEAYLIRDYYGLEWDAPLSIEQVLAEGFGKGRKQLKAAVRSAFAGVAADDDRKHREKLGDSGFVWDATAYELEQRVSDELGLNDILTYCIAGNPRGTHIPQIRDFADRLAAMQDTLGEGSKLFGHAIPWRNPNNPTSHYGDTVKWLGMILSNKFGIRSTSTKHRTSEGITTIYTCRQDDIDRLKAAVERKAGSLIDKGFHPRSTPLGKIFTQGVDHRPKMVSYCGMQWYFARRNGENFICVEDADPSDPNEWLLAPQDLAA